MLSLRGAEVRASSTEAHGQDARATGSLRGADSSPPNAFDGFDRRWFMLYATVNTYPELQREQLISKYFNPAMRFFAPTFENVRTISDLRDEHLLWVPHIGIGRALSPHWAFFVQGGYSGGKVRTNAINPSLLLFPLSTDLEIRRDALYAGVALDYFPFGMPVLREYDGVWSRLIAARPSFGARLTVTRASFRAKVKVGFRPFGNLVSLRLEDAWVLPSVNTNVGLDVPISKRGALSFNAGVNFFFEEEQDFEGTAFTIAWKHFLD